MYATSPAHLQAISGGAGHQFQRARLRAWFSQWWAALTRRSWKLLELSAVMSTADVVEQHYAGLHAVPVRQIQGSENRAADFDCDFNPLSDRIRQRWTNVFNAWQKGAALPPVDLIQNGYLLRARRASPYLGGAYARTGVYRSSGDAVEGQVLSASLANFPGGRIVEI